MKPRTKLQKQVVELSNQLPPISEKQMSWAFERCLAHSARRVKRRITCLDCAHDWNSKEDLIPSKTKCICPNCKRELEINDTKKRNFKSFAYFGIITTFKGFQVLRYFLVNGTYKLGEQAYRYMYEVAQHWIRPDGKYETMGMLEGQSFYSEYWYDKLEIRVRGNSNYNFSPKHIYPYKSYLSEVKRCGFRGEFHDSTPLSMFVTILTNNQAETLLKTNQTSLLRHCIHRPNDIEEHWSSIRICIRNNYIVHDASIWIDQLNLLSFFGKDLRSPKYVCPNDIDKEHHIYIEKRRRVREKEELEEAKVMALKDEALYFEMKEHLLDIQMSDGLIEIRPLQSVSEFITEGDYLHHCVFQSSYYLREDSLILSARIDNIPIETIEFSLTKNKVVQCRGKYNKSSEHHDRILDLVNRNVEQISKRVSA